MGFLYSGASSSDRVKNSDGVDETPNSGKLPSGGNLDAGFLRRSWRPVVVKWSTCLTSARGSLGSWCRGT